jgi:predicted HTH domain antitoxin
MLEILGTEIIEMAELCFEIPDDLFHAMKLPPGEAQVRIRSELAVRLYEKGVLGFGKARELAQLSGWEFHELLGREGIVRRYDVDEFEEDMKTLEDLN